MKNTRYATSIRKASAWILLTASVTATTSVRAAVEITHNVTGGKYSPGQALSVDLVIGGDTLEAPLRGLAITPTLPAGWTLGAAQGTGDDTAMTIELAPAGDSYLWSGGDAGAFPITITYAVNTTAQSTGDKDIRSSVNVTDGNYDPFATSFWATPDPLTLSELKLFNTMPDAATVNEDTEDNIIDVLGNDTDDGGTTVTQALANDPTGVLAQAKVTALNGQQADQDGNTDDINTTNGQVFLENGVVLYDPNENFFGQDTFTYTAEDGDGNSDTATVTVTVDNVNDLPQLDLWGGPLLYVEDSGQQLLNGQQGNVNVTDQEGTDFNGGQLIAYMPSYVPANNVLSVMHEGNAAGQIGVGGGTVSYGGQPIGTIAGGQDSDLVISLNAAVDTTTIRALISGLTYANASQDPSEEHRKVHVFLDDGDSAAQVSSHVFGVDIMQARNADGTFMFMLDVETDSSVRSIDVTTPGSRGAFTLTQQGLAQGGVERGYWADRHSGRAEWYVEAEQLASLDAYGDGDYTLTFNYVNGTDSGPVTVPFGPWGLPSDPTMALVNPGGGVDDTSYYSFLGSIDPSAHIVMLMAESGDDDTDELYPVSATQSDTFGDMDIGDGVWETEVLVAYAARSTVDGIPTTTRKGALVRDEVVRGNVYTISGTIAYGQGVAVPPTGTLGADIQVLDGQFTRYAGEAEVTGNTYSVRVPPGTYYVQALHDTNDNRSHDYLEPSGLYDNNPQWPGTPIVITNADAPGRNITLQPNQGDGGGGLPTRTVVVESVNDAPTVAATQANLVTTEGDNATVIDGALAVADADDSALNGATVAITANYVQGEDVLAFQTTPQIVGNWNAGNGTLTLSAATATSPTVAEVQAALRTVTYQNTNGNDPDVQTRTVTVTVTDCNSDGIGSVVPGTLTGMDTRDVEVTAVNDAPTMNATAAALDYTEGDGQVAVDAGVTLADVDDDNMTGAEVRITTNYDNGEDRLAFVDQGGITGDFNITEGKLTLTGGATNAAYQAALRTVTYENQNTGDPGLGPRTVELKVSDANSDGEGGGRVAQWSTPVTRTINIAAVNDAPDITGSGTALPYTEGDAAAAIDNTINVTDLDDTNMNGATVVVFAGYQSGADVLDYPAQIGNITGSFTAGNATLTLQGSDSRANYVTALRSITYQNTSEAPTEAARTIRFTVTDSNSAGNGGTRAALNDVFDRVVNVDAKNDAPRVLVADLDLDYTEDDGAVALDAAFTLSDVDDTQMAGATVVISANYQNGEDVLALPAPVNNITGAWNAGTLTLQGADTVANYQTAIRTVTYENTNAGNPNTSTRTVTVTVTDSNSGGIGDRAALAGNDTRDITVAARNDAPVLDGSGDLVLTAIDEDVQDGNNAGDTVAALLASDGGTPITDADGAAQDAIAVTGADSSNGAWEYDTGARGWTGFGTPAPNNAVLLDADDKIRFVPNADWNGAVNPGITFRAWDETTGTSGDTGVDTTTNGGTTAFSTATETAAITVNSINDTPVAYDAFESVLAGQQPAQVREITLRATDIDSAVAEYWVSVNGGNDWTMLQAGDPTDVDATAGGAALELVAAVPAQGNPPVDVEVKVRYTLPAGNVAPDFTDTFLFRTKDAEAAPTRTDLWSNNATVTVRTGVITTLTSQTAETAEDAGAANHQATFTVELAFAPGAGEVVTVDMVSSDTTEGAIDPTTLAFTAANWNVPAAVTVTGVNDDVDDGDIGYQIDFDVDSTDDGSAFEDFPVTPLALTNIDDDTAGVTVSEATANVTEGGATDTYTVVLDSEPTQNVAVTLNYDENQLGLGASRGALQLDFTPANWDTAQTVTITPVEDDLVEGPQQVVIQQVVASTDALYNGGDPDVGDVTVNVTDNDTATVAFQAATGATANEAAATHNVQVALAINSTPANGRLGAVVTVDVTDQGSGSATSGVDYTALPAGKRTIQFPVNSQAGTLPAGIDVQPDLLIEGDETIDLGLAVTGGPATAVAPTAHTATITDDDFATVAFVNATSNTGNEATAAHNVVVELSTTAGGTLAGPVTVDVTDQLTGSATSGTDYTAWPGNEKTVQFAAGSQNGSQQNVSIDVQQDDYVEGDETVALGLAVAGGVATSVAPTAHTTTIIDDDTATIAFQNPVSATNDEAGATHNVNVELVIDSTPAGGKLAAPVSVDITDQTTGSAASGTDYTAWNNNKKTVQFAADSQAGTQPVGIDVLQDALVEGDETVVLGLAVVGAGPVQDGAQTAHTATITDDDIATVAFNQAASATVDEQTATHDVAVDLMINSTPAGATLVQAVVVDVTDQGTGTATSGTDYTAWTNNKKTIQFAAGTGAASQNAGIDVIDDPSREGDETVDLDLTIVSGIAAAVNPSAHTATIKDDDVPGVTISKANGAVTEGGAGDSYTVVLNTQPTANVTVTVHYDDSQINTAKATRAPNTTDLTFTPTLWGQAQTVNVAAVDDTIVEGTHNAAITHSSASADADYAQGAIAINNIDIGITDNDTATVEFNTATTQANEGDPQFGIGVALRTSPTGATLGAAVTADVRDLGTGTVTDDYQQVGTSTYTFNAGAQDGDVVTQNFGINDDRPYEDPETINFVLENVTGQATLGTVTNHTVTIVDNDPDAQSARGFTKAGEATQDGKHIELLVTDETNTGASLTYWAGKGPFNPQQPLVAPNPLDDNDLTALNGATTWQGGTLEVLQVQQVSGPTRAQFVMKAIVKYTPPPAVGGKLFRGLDKFYYVVKDENDTGVSIAMLVQITVGTPPWYPYIAWDDATVGFYQVRIVDKATGAQAFATNISGRTVVDPYAYISRGSTGLEEGDYEVYYRELDAGTGAWGAWVQLDDITVEYPDATQPTQLAEMAETDGTRAATGNWNFEFLPEWAAGYVMEIYYQEATGAWALVRTFEVVFQPDADGVVLLNQLVEKYGVYLGREGWYKWRVLGFNPEGDGPWSAERQFQVAAVPDPTEEPPRVDAATMRPGAVNDGRDHDGNAGTPNVGVDTPLVGDGLPVVGTAEGDTYPVTFQWDSAVGARLYRVYVETYGDEVVVNRVAVTGGNTSYGPVSLRPGRYRWHVIAINDIGVKEWSRPVYFAIKADIAAVDPLPLLDDFNAAPGAGGVTFTGNWEVPGTALKLFVFNVEQKTGVISTYAAADMDNPANFAARGQDFSFTVPDPAQNEPGVVYQYSARGVTGTKRGPWSDRKRYAGYLPAGGAAQISIPEIQFNAATWGASTEINVIGATNAAQMEFEAFVFDLTTGTKTNDDPPNNIAPVAADANGDGTLLKANLPAAFTAGQTILYIRARGTNAAGAGGWSDYLMLFN